MGMRFDSFFPMEVHGILSTVGLLDILDILLVAVLGMRAKGAAIATAAAMIKAPNWKNS